MNKCIKTLWSVALSILVLGCSSSDETSNNNSNEVNGADYLYYVSGKLNGETFFYGQRSDATTQDYTLSNSIPLQGATCAYARDNDIDAGISFGASISTGFNEDETIPSISFDFIRFYLCSNPNSSNEVFNDLFPVATYEFATNESPYSVDEVNQVAVSYSPTPSSDTYYQSFDGNQSNSYFKITVTEESNIYFGASVFQYNQTVEGEYSVKLVNVDDSTDIIEITEGRFKISLAK